MIAPLVLTSRLSRKVKQGLPNVATLVRCRHKGGSGNRGATDAEDIFERRLRGVSLGGKGVLVVMASRLQLRRHHAEFPKTNQCLKLAS